MDEAHQALRLATASMFIGLSMRAFFFWRARRDAPSAWMLATLGDLAIVMTVAIVIPTTHVSRWSGPTRTFLVMVLAALPYSLFEFSESFTRSGIRRRRMARAATVVVALGAVLVGPLPVGGQPRTAPVEAYVILFLVHWLGLSALAIGRLWRHSKQESRIIRYRMRTLAVGGGLLALAVLAAGAAQPSARPGAAQIITQLLALCSGPFFLVGFAPPAVIRALWRRSDVSELFRSVRGLLAAGSRRDVLEALVPRAMLLLGGTHASFVGKDGTVVQAAGARDERTISMDPVEMRFSSDEGELTVRASAYAPHFGDEEADLVRALTALTDIALARAELTERESLMRHEVEEANEALREFVAIASHDLRTPLTVIQGFASTLDRHWDDFADDDRRKYFAAILRQSEHLAKLTEDLLTVSRIDAGAVVPRLECVPLKGAVDAVVNELPGLPDSLLVRIPHDLDVVADSEYLHRILRNLLENAANHGRPPIEITGVCSVRDGRVLLTVRDHGPGVPPDFEPRLFEKFARADRKQAAPTRGTGLGLTIVRGLARAMGGDVTYEPVPIGASFVVELPSKEEA